MTAKFFVDTNVAIYAVETDEPNRQQALAVMHLSPVISTQVVNEFLNVLLVKRQLDRPSAYELARALMQGCNVIAVTAEITEQAMALTFNQKDPAVQVAWRCSREQSQHIWSPAPPAANVSCTCCSPAPA